MTNSPEERADAHYNKARCVWSSENYTEAVTELGLCLDLEPRHSEARLLLGEIYLFKSEHLGLSDAAGETAARREFEHLLTENPQKTEAWAGLALVLLYQNDYAGALKAADSGFKVIASDTSWNMGSPEVFMNVAESLYDIKIRAYLENNEKERALAQLQEGLTFCPNSTFLARHLSAE